jgi:hypothetical protein
MKHDDRKSLDNHGVPLAAHWSKLSIAVSEDSVLKREIHLHNLGVISYDPLYIPPFPAFRIFATYL